MPKGRTTLGIVQKMFPGVTEVVDAVRPRIIEVEQADLRRAEVQNHKSCAMAVACKRKLNLDGVIMARSTAYLIRGRKATRYSVPESITREIISFDRGAAFAPGQYRLIPPLRKMGEQAGPRSPHTETGSAPRYHHTTSGVRALLGSTIPAAEVS